MPDLINSPKLKPYFALTAEVEVPVDIYVRMFW